MTADESPRLHHVPRVHAAFLAGSVDQEEHALSPASETSLCGIVDGEISRHLFEDVPRGRTCAKCQALTDAVRAADLLDAVAGAVGRGDLTMQSSDLASLEDLRLLLLSSYAPDPSEPNFDVRYAY